MGGLGGSLAWPRNGGLAQEALGGLRKTKGQHLTAAGRTPSKLAFAHCHRGYAVDLLVLKPSLSFRISASSQS